MLSHVIEKVAKRNEGPYFGEILDTMSDKEYDTSKRFFPTIAKGVSAIPKGWQTRRKLSEG